MLKIVVNMFNVNNKDTRVASMDVILLSLLLTLNIFNPKIPAESCEIKY